MLARQPHFLLIGRFVLPEQLLAFDWIHAKGK
jgi:hypothetical protein